MRSLIFSSLDRNIEISVQMYRAVTDLYLNTDRYIVEMKIRIKLAATSQPRLSTPKILKPNLTQWQRYNESVSVSSFFFALTSHAAEP